MKEYIDYITNKIQKSFDITEVQVIDNSELHRGHKFFNEEKYHLCLEIKSKTLREMKKIDAQRAIMKVLKNELKNKIHALEIKII